MYKHKKVVDRKENARIYGLCGTGLTVIIILWFLPLGTIPTLISIIPASAVGLRTLFSVKYWMGEGGKEQERLWNS